MKRSRKKKQGGRLRVHTELSLFLVVVGLVLVFFDDPNHLKFLAFISAYLLLVLFWLLNNVLGLYIWATFSIIVSYATLLNEKVLRMVLRKY